MKSDALDPIPSTRGDIAGATILERVLEVHALDWTRQEAEGIERLCLDPLPASSSPADHHLAQQFGIYLELMKCRARRRIRSLSRPH